MPEVNCKRFINCRNDQHEDRVSEIKCKMVNYGKKVRKKRQQGRTIQQLSDDTWEGDTDDVIRTFTKSAGNVPDRSRVEHAGKHGCQNSTSTGAAAPRHTAEPARVAAVLVYRMGGFFFCIVLYVLFAEPHCRFCMVCLVYTVIL